MTVLRFAQKFAENLGMPNFFGFDRLIAVPREPNEANFVLDPSLYYSESSNPQQHAEEAAQNQRNRDKLGKVDLLDAPSDGENNSHYRQANGTANFGKKESMKKQ